MNESGESDSWFSNCEVPEKCLGTGNRKVNRAVGVLVLPYPIHHILQPKQLEWHSYVCGLMCLWKKKFSGFWGKDIKLLEQMTSSSAFLCFSSMISKLLHINKFFNILSTDFNASLSHCTKELGWTQNHWSVLTNVCSIVELFLLNASLEIQ